MNYNRARAALRRTLDEACYVFWPRRCPVCDDWVAQRAHELHRTCVSNLRLSEWAGTPHPVALRRGVPVAWVFQDDPAFFRVLHAIKYERRIHLLPRLLEHLPVPPHWPASSFLVPMPDSPKRSRLRGFSVTGTLARGLVQLGWGARVAHGLLSRRREGVAQAKLERPVERWTNASGLFGVGRLAEVPVRTPLILVDDQITSGATMGSALQFLGVRGNPIMGLALGGAHQAPREVHLDTHVHGFLDS